MKNFLDGGKESETNTGSEVAERCGSQRKAEQVITEPSVSDNVKRTEEEAKSESDFNVNSNFKGNLVVDMAETALLSTTKLL